MARKVSSFDVSQAADVVYLLLLKSADTPAESVLRAQLEAWRDREADTFIKRRIEDVLNGVIV